MDVRLRKLREADLPPLVRARVEESESIAYPAPTESEIGSRMRERIEHSGKFHAGEILLGIESAGRLVGEIQARQPRDGLPPGVFELGIAIFDEDDRDKGMGSQAIKQMLKRLFSQQGAHRVQATTDVDNARMRWVLEAIGFGFEGVLRGFMPSNAGPRDYAMYAITTADLEGTSWTRTN